MTLSKNEIQEKAREILSKVDLGHSWTDKRGVKHRRLLLNGTIVGEVHGDVNLTELTVDDYRVTPKGTKVFLFAKGVLVGHLWID